MTYIYIIYITYIILYILHTYRKIERQNTSRHIFKNNIKSVSFQIAV